MSDSTSQRASASRQHDGSDSRTVLSPAYERREIGMAYGAQGHEDQLPEKGWVNQHVTEFVKKFPNVERINEGEYRNHKQRVIYLLRSTKKKSTFRKWLETPGLHVVYSGHARGGRGPCFGRIEDHGKGEDWNEGADRATSGIFRMGFPFVPEEAGEIVSHGYTAHILRADEEVPASEDCHPRIRPYLRSLRAMEPEKLQEGLTPLLRGHKEGDRYWAFRPGGGPWHVIHHAGWNETDSKPNDWGSIKVNCRVMCHFGCSTFIHNYPVMRELAGWRREDNERYAYWTTSVSNGFTLPRWIANLITYDVENANQSWEKSLEDARTRTNQQIRAAGYGFQIR